MLTQHNVGLRARAQGAQSIRGGHNAYRSVVSRSQRRNAVVVRAAEDGPAPEGLKVMLAGAPAAGKGTQGAKIVNKYGLVHISVGDLLREEVKKGSPDGQIAKSYMEKGALVPDDVVAKLVKHRLAADDVMAKGWLLDGYPRSGPQARAAEHEDLVPDVFLLLEVSEDHLVERIKGLRVDPLTGEIYNLKHRPPPAEAAGRLETRFDDSEESVRARLKTFKQHLGDVLKYYKKELVIVDGNRSIDDVSESITAVLDEAWTKKDKLEQYCAGAPEADECRVYED